MSARHLHRIDEAKHMSWFYQLDVPGRPPSAVRPANVPRMYQNGEPQLLTSLSILPLRLSSNL
jgi:hypothetical protein